MQFLDIVDFQAGRRVSDKRSVSEFVFIFFCINSCNSAQSVFWSQIRSNLYLQSLSGSFYKAYFCF